MIFSFFPGWLPLASRRLVWRRCSTRDLSREAVVLNPQRQAGRLQHLNQPHFSSLPHIKGTVRWPSRASGAWIIKAIFAREKPPRRDARFGEGKRMCTDWVELLLQVCFCRITPETACAWIWTLCTGISQACGAFKKKKKKERCSKEQRLQREVRGKLGSFSS